jgi:hypothetical protein
MKVHDINMFSHYQFTDTENSISYFKIINNKSNEWVVFIYNVSLFKDYKKLNMVLYKHSITDKRILKKIELK